MNQPSHWDAIVIGTGFGGSSVALKLAAAGVRVLLLERGRSPDRDDSAWDTRAIHVEQKYRSATHYEIHTGKKHELTYPDDTVGGKSIFYGGASLRLRAEDFRADARFHGDDLAGLPPMDWPIEYSDFEPFYGEAEREIGIAGVAGTDPTESHRSTAYEDAPPTYGTTARIIASAANKLGLKPFPLPLAINFHENNGRAKCQMCMTCDMFPCKVGAKNDLSVTVIPKAMSLGATVREGIVAKRLVLKERRIRSVECMDTVSGESYTLTCDLCIVSCGAIASTGLLIESGLHHTEPNGQLLGRYLMRHCSGIAVGIFPFKTNPEQQFHKQVAITDFYFGREGRKPTGPWGMIQALQTATREFVSLKAPNWFIEWSGIRTLPYQAYLLCLAEDLPNAANRVELSETETDQYGAHIARVFHKHDKRDLAARHALYKEAGRILRRAGSVYRTRMNIKTFSHALGTARFGTDPANAVLDPQCRFFGVPNLFVVDGSFMPSVGGVNPSLTIAANGLRVGEYLAAHWDEVISGSHT